MYSSIINKKVERAETMMNIQPTPKDSDKGKRTPRTPLAGHHGKNLIKHKNNFHKTYKIFFMKRWLEFYSNVLN